LILKTAGAAGGRRTPAKKTVILLETKKRKEKREIDISTVNGEAEGPGNQKSRFSDKKNKQSPTKKKVRFEGGDRPVAIMGGGGGQGHGRVRAGGRKRKGKSRTENT